MLCDVTVTSVFYIFIDYHVQNYKANKRGPVHAFEAICPMFKGK